MSKGERLADSSTPRQWMLKLRETARGFSLIVMDAWQTIDDDNNQERAAVVATAKPEQQQATNDNSYDTSGPAVWSSRVWRWEAMTTMRRRRDRWCHASSSNDKNNSNAKMLAVLVSIVVYLETPVSRLLLEQRILHNKARWYGLVI